MIKFPAIFSDNMVLQREKKITIFGSSNGQAITATMKDDMGNVVNQKSVKVGFGNKALENASTSGNFSIDLSPMAAGGPYKLCVSDGEDERVFQNIMIGEVWLAGGQSNMEFELGNSKGGQELVANATAIMKETSKFANKNQEVNTEVRFYYVPKIAYECEELFEAEKNSSWEMMTPNTCSRWSAVGYYFARRISAELGVTVGIIGCNWGGTSAACWTGREFLESNKNAKKYVDEYDEAVAGRTEEEYLEQYAYYKKHQTIFEKNVGEYYRTHENPTWEEALELYGENLYPGPMGSRNERRMGGLYEVMLKRVMPYSLRGFLFYQAEEDDHRPYTYGDVFETLIKQWRHDWKDDKLPFLFVQLPMFADMDVEDFKNWPFLREAQMKVFDTVKNTGIAVALDMGEYGNIHPIDKVPVGERLALQAMYSVYGMIEEEVAFGPIYKDYVVNDNIMEIYFDHAKDGFTIVGDEIVGFEIAGSDKVFYPAVAKICDSKIQISSDNVTEPVFARYCWVNYGEVTLFGKNGIPVAPFRTSSEDGAVATGSRQGFIITE